jgi:ABC-type Fe3+/spermidine/putrescine transport system ATPase subunit
MSIIEVKNLTYKYENKLIINNVDFVAKSSEITAILGPSGSGKSTFIKLLAGFLKPDKGKILLDNKSINSLEPHKRNIAYVSQTPSLFPFMTIYENIKLAIRDQDEAVKKILVKKLLSKFSISNKFNSYPHNLSVGEQQRVSIIRALASDSKVLLFDEPYANLDSLNKDNLISESLNLLKNSNLIKIMITHNTEEAILFADKIYVIYGGKILQYGSAAELYKNPKNEFVARAFSLVNRFKHGNREYLVRATDFAITTEEKLNAVRVKILAKKFYFGKYLYHVQKSDMDNLRIISEQNFKISEFLFIYPVNKIKID